MELILLCGSHIDSIDRLYALGRAIKSIEKQSTKIIISISCSIYVNSLEEEIKAFVNRYADASDTIKLHLQPKQCSQFQHYNIIRKYPFTQENGVCFSMMMISLIQIA